MVQGNDDWLKGREKAVAAVDVCGLTRRGRLDERERLYGIAALTVTQGVRGNIICRTVCSVRERALNQLHRTCS